MMDFLRGLAPMHASDPTRAVALLPSRFASEHPLQATIARDRPVQPLEDEDAALPPAAASPSMPGSTPAAQGPALASAPPSRTAPRPLATEAARRVKEEAISPAHAPAREKARSGIPARADAPAIHRVHPGVDQEGHGEHPERTGPARPAPQVLAALAASPGLQVAAAPPAQARAALPLSQAILAQRTLESRDDSQVVHVTIGRIDVVANTAPAPAVRHSPSPRPATVTLADYLRASKGGPP